MVRAKKHLGQHFLKNPGIASRIADSLSGKGYGQMLEIGPGMGILTRHLQQRSEELFVVEIDTESVNFLLENFAFPQNRIIEADFLRLPVPELFHEPLAVVGNFPYNISTQIIFKVLEHREMIPEVVGMFQKEVAERIVAPPGSKTYGIISVLVAAEYEREYLFTVEPEEFSPPPKVRSGVIRLTRKKEKKEEYNEALFKAVVKTAFNQRRKTLRNALKSLNLSTELAGEELFNKRAEQLSLQDFIYITNSIKA